jgi:hypothetical protein
MPFKSKAQMRYFWENHPDIARRWEKEYNQTGKGLPEHVQKKPAKRKKKGR